MTRPTLPRVTAAALGYYWVGISRSRRACRARKRKRTGNFLPIAATRQKPAIEEDEDEIDRENPYL
jgi:hypothetical protein